MLYVLELPALRGYNERKKSWSERGEEVVPLLVKGLKLTPVSDRPVYLYRRCAVCGFCRNRLRCKIIARYTIYSSLWSKAGLIFYKYVCFDKPGVTKTKVILPRVLQSPAIFKTLKDDAKDWAYGNTRGSILALKPPKFWLKGLRSLPN